VISWSTERSETRVSNVKPDTACNRYVSVDTRHLTACAYLAFPSCQDVHLATSSVREALEFSALLRQPRHIPNQEKLDYVDEVLKLLEMEAYQHAVVGDLGEGESRTLAEEK
jgi:ABC-type multidrug transport system ATPase subunit